MARPLTYTSEQNLYHFTRALQVVNEPQLSTIPRPHDCPESRWRSLLREARRSLPSAQAACDSLVRSSYGARKRIEMAVHGAGKPRK